MNTTIVIVFSKKEQIDIIKNKKYKEVNNMFKLLSKKNKGPSIEEVKRLFKRYAKKQDSFSLFFDCKFGFFSYSNRLLLTKQQQNDYMNYGSYDLTKEEYIFNRYNFLLRKEKLKDL